MVLAGIEQVGAVPRDCDHNSVHCHPLPCDAALSTLSVDLHAALYIGIGRVMQGRRDIFNQGSGIAVHLEQRVFSIPPFPGAPIKRTSPDLLQLLRWLSLEVDDVITNNNTY